MSAQQLGRYCSGRTEPTRQQMVRLVEATTRMRRCRVFMIEMFELAPSDEAVFPMVIELIDVGRKAEEGSR